MLDLSEALQDPELGYAPYSVLRTVYRRRNGESVPTEQTISAMGCIHPGTPEMMQLLPEENRREEFIAIYTDFSLSNGDNPGGAVYTAADRILWKGETWRVVKVRDWEDFGYHQGLAVKLRE